MKIKKVKLIKDDKIFIAYEKENNSGHIDKHQMTCAENASPGFYKALKDLKSDAMNLCEFNKAMEDRLSIRGVRFGYIGEENTMSASIIVQLELKNSEGNLNIITPTKQETVKEGEGEKDKLLSGESIKHLKAVMDECQNFIEGQREQTEITFGKTKK